MRLFAAALVVAVACGDPDDASTPLPCDVDTVLAAECRLCHNPKLEFGAPMALQDWEDTQEIAPSASSGAVWEVMRERINSSSSPMPPGGVGAFSDDDRAVLNAWFAIGAAPGDGVCN